MKKKQTYQVKKGLMGNATDYHVHEASVKEDMIGFMIAFALGFAVIFIFFRSIIFATFMGTIAGIIGIRIYNKHLLEKRKKQLLIEFKDLMEALSTSYSAGNNTMAAFQDSYNDLVNTYGEKADIVKEVELILAGLRNGYNIQSLLKDFAVRSELEDIANFADVFEISSIYGANIQRVVGETRTMINEKIEIEQEIEMQLNSGKNELNILMVLPFVIVAVMNSDSSMSVAGNSHSNILIKIIALFIFGIAYFIGKKIVKIEI